MKPGGIPTWLAVIALLKAGGYPLGDVPQLRTNLTVMTRDSKQLLAEAERAAKRAPGDKTLRDIVVDLLTTQSLLKEAMGALDAENWAKAADCIERWLPIYQAGTERWAK